MSLKFIMANAALLAIAAPAAATTFTFEEIDNYYRPASFYAGGQAIYAGTGRPDGPTGPDLGVYFSGAPIIFERNDKCAGCNGLFPDAPSGISALYNFPSSSTGRPLTVVDIAAGFTGSVSVWHFGGSSGMSVYGNVGGQDGFMPALLGNVSMPQTEGCDLVYPATGGVTVTGATCVWSRYTLSFDGTARSIELYGGGSYFDDLTFNADAVPEPATWAMMLIGFGATGAVLRRRRGSTFRLA